MKYKKNKFHRVCCLKNWQKINAPIPKSLLSAIFMNWQTMCLTRKNCLQIKRISWFDDPLLQKQNKCGAYYVLGRHSNCDCLYLSQNYFKLPCQSIRENANLICLFLKTKRMLVTFLTTTCLKTWQKNSSKNFAKQHGRSLITLLWLIWPHQKTVGNTDQGLTTFILFNKWTLKFS